MLLTASLFIAEVSTIISRVAQESLVDALFVCTGPQCTARGLLCGHGGAGLLLVRMILAVQEAVALLRQRDALMGLRALELGW